MKEILDIAYSMNTKKRKISKEEILGTYKRSLRLRQN
jgi:hypothetical protein